MKFREYSKLKYLDPEEFLVKVEEMLKELQPQLYPHAAYVLKSRAARELQEDRRCAALCYGIAQVSGAKIGFCNIERSDFDYMLAVEKHGICGFIPLQMKQLVPSRVNAKTSLQKELEKLRKYATSPDLSVAIHVNRKVLVELERLDLSGLKVGELWIFGSVEPEQRRWRIIGNLLSQHCGSVTYTLPAA